LVSQENSRCAYGLLDGGRNSLLRSAQEATLTSLAISALQRQSQRRSTWGGEGVLTVTPARLAGAPGASDWHNGPAKNARAGLYTEADDTTAMEQLWTPWRYAYVTAADGVIRSGVPAELKAWPGDLGCVFCNLIASVDYAIANGMDRDAAEAAGGVILRGRHCFICLNAFPYTSGHVMVMPYAHLDRLAALPHETAQELMALAQRTELALQRVYSPEGFNFGMNVGRSAGAGVASHIHLHAMPRWTGDTSFMTTVADTRVLPEELGTTWKRLREMFLALDTE
jgi:ATP adenylyltransferase